MILWRSKIVDPAGNVLPPGSVSFLKYPEVQFEHAAANQLSEVVGGQLAALEWVIHQVAAEPQRVFYRHDTSGSGPAHALLVSNHNAAVKLVLEIYTRWPRLITLTLGKSSFGCENALHILAANRREPQLCQALETAQLRLSDKQYHELLTLQFGGRLLGLVWPDPHAGLPDGTGGQTAQGCTARWRQRGEEA
eukprot:5984181-Prymnesium_polylepis.1